MKPIKQYLLPLFSLVLGIFAYPRDPEKSSLLLDLNGVVLKTDTLQALKSTGITPFLPVIIDGLSKLDPHAFTNIAGKVRAQTLYPFLEKLQPYQQNSVPAYDDHGNRMPQVMVEWMKGTVSGPELQARIQEALALKSSWFKNDSEKRVIQAITSLMFTPNRLADSQKIMPETVAFVRECKAKGHPLYILSNFDADSFAHIQQKNQDFFNLVDGVVISGQCGHLKPEPAIYEHILRAYQLDAANCFFIDDIPANIQAAQHAGIVGAVCKNNDISTIKSAYQQWMQE